MFVVLFEVQPRPERWNDYLELAKFLKPKLEAIDGFIDNERFASQRAASQRNGGRLLSLSTWRDEKSLVRWRTQGDHHGVQEKGRGGVFEDYRLRVGEVTADSAPPAGFVVAQQRFDETETGAAKIVTITEWTAPPDFAPNGCLEHEWFESIANTGKFLLLAGWRDAIAAQTWTPPAGSRHRLVRVIRGYGMFDRREAPQYYPAPKPAP